VVKITARTTDQAQIAHDHPELTSAVIDRGCFHGRHVMLHIGRPVRRSTASITCFPSFFQRTGRGREPAVAIFSVIAFGAFGAAAASASEFFRQVQRSSVSAGDTARAARRSGGRLIICSASTEGSRLIGPHRRRRQRRPPDRRNSGKPRFATAYSENHLKLSCKVAWSSHIASAAIPTLALAGDFAQATSASHIQRAARPEPRVGHS